MDKIFEVNTQLNSKTVLDLNNLWMVYVHLAIVPWQMAQTAKRKKEKTQIETMKLGRYLRSLPKWSRSREKERGREGEKEQRQMNGVYIT